MVLVVGFLLVGGLAAWVTARLTRRNRDPWDD